MLYQPKSIKEMWDTWLYFHNGTHYLFTLHLTESRWDGITLATSPDGVHFSDRGIILSKRPEAVWLGTGAVWEYTDGFVMNYSLEVDGRQRICFAISQDFLHWEPLPPEFDFLPDSKFYDDTPAGRWDCIWPVRREEGGYYGFFTANPLCEDQLTLPSVGAATSSDGIHWEALPPPRFEWKGHPVNVGEVGAVELINGKFYMLVGMNELEFGMREYSRADLGDMGMYVFVSENIMGPYQLQEDNPRILVSHAYPDWISHYFTRFYPINETGELLICHHSLERAPGNNAKVWLAPLKKTILEGNTLWMGWWEQNNVLRGTEIFYGFNNSRVVWPLIPRGWKIEKEIFSAKEPHHGGKLELERTFDLDRGIFLSAEVLFDTGDSAYGGVGFYFDCGDICEYVLVRKGQSEIGKLWRDKYLVRELCSPHPLQKNSLSILLLARNSMVEWYADGHFLQSHSLHSRPTGKIGIVFECCSVEINNLSICEWTL